MHYLAIFIGLSFLVILSFSLCMRRITGMPSQAAAIPIKLPDAHKGRDPQQESQKEPERLD
jgi:hypothetical protein